MQRPRFDGCTHWRDWFTGTNDAAIVSMAVVPLGLGMTLIAVGWVVAPIGGVAGHGHPRPPVA